VSAKSPTALSLDFLNKCGYVCHIVEKRLPIPGKHITQDCYGIADILAYHSRHGIALVQTTTAHNMEARRRKILASPHFEGWKRAGGKFILHGWGKNGCEGGWL
jgi:hypothetical protein